MYVYINGVLNRSAAVTGTIYTSSDPMYIGGLPNGSGSNFGAFNGNIADVRVYNTAMNASQIQSVMKTETNGSESNLVYSTRFSQNSSNAIVDQTSTPSNGTLKGTASVSGQVSIWNDATYTFSSTKFTTDYIFQDADNHAFSAIKVTSLPSGGTLTLSGTPVAVNDEISSANLSNLVYTPTTDYYGTDTFGWQAKDANDEYSLTQNMQIEVKKAKGTVNTSSSSNIGDIGATVSGSLDYLGKSSITDRGVVYGISSSPTISGAKVSLGSTSSTGSITANITSLNPNTLYYARAYVTNGSGTDYGSEIQFTTLANPQTITWTPSADKQFGDANFGLVATASSGLTPTFTSQTTSVCTVSGSTLTIVAAGRCIVTAAQAGNTSFSAATSVKDTLQILPAVIISNVSAIDQRAGATAVASPNLTITGNGTMDGATVQITGSYVTGDTLKCPTTGSFTCSWDNSKKRLLLTGTGSLASYQAALRNVQLTTSTDATNRNISVVFGVGTALPFSESNHFYEAVNSNNITWMNAKTAAEARKYYGIPGYLATILSSTENSYIHQKLGADAWIGAVDDYNFVNTTGYSFADQNAVEGKWHWVTGPEAGTQFSNGNNSPSVVNSQYNNWNPGEPNNSSNSEHYGEIYSSSAPGKWNDCPNTGCGSINYYVTEYGSPTADPSSLFATGSGTIIPKSNQTITFSGTVDKLICSPKTGQLRH